jgi:hypothetical protein
MFVFCLALSQNCEYQLCHVSLFVRSSARMGHLGSHWTEFGEIWYLSFFRALVEKIQPLLKSEKNNWYFTRRRMYTYYMSLNY